MKKILIVEDNVPHRRMLKELLENENYEVIEAANGEEGYLSYNKDFCDLVITDIDMPIKNGHNLIEDLLAENPDVKIIAISGKGFLKGEHFLSIAKGLGAKKIIKKPMKSNELINAMKRLL